MISSVQTVKLLRHATVQSRSRIALMILMTSLCIMHSPPDNATWIPPISRNSSNTEHILSYGKNIGLYSGT